MRSVEGIRRALEGVGMGGMVRDAMNNLVSRDSVTIVSGPAPEPIKSKQVVRQVLNRNLLGPSAYTEMDPSKRIYRHEIQDITPVKLFRMDAINPWTYAVAPVEGNQHLLKRLNLGIEDCYHNQGVPSFVLGTYLVPAMKLDPPEPDTTGPLDWYGTSEIVEHTVYFSHMQLASSQRRLANAHLLLKEKVEQAEADR